MPLFVSWVAFPLLLSALTLGCGLLLEHAAGRRLPGALVLPAGFAVVIVASSLTTMSAATAGFTAPLVVALAVAGVGLSIRDRRRPDVWTAAAALAVFCVYAAPIVLSGSATFAGYISLDDTATWLALVDNAMTHGRSLAGLAPSTYSALLRVDLGTGYPIGSMLPLGVGHELTGQDAAWLFQPYIAFVAAMVSLSRVRARLAASPKPTPSCACRVRRRAARASLRLRAVERRQGTRRRGARRPRFRARRVGVDGSAARPRAASAGGRRRRRARLPERSRPRLACRTRGGRRCRRRRQRCEARQHAARVRARLLPGARGSCSGDRPAVRACQRRQRRRSRDTRQPVPSAQQPADPRHLAQRRFPRPTNPSGRDLPAARAACSRRRVRRRLGGETAGVGDPSLPGCRGRRLGARYRGRFARARVSVARRESVGVGLPSRAGRRVSPAPQCCSNAGGRSWSSSGRWRWPRSRVG